MNLRPDPTFYASPKLAMEGPAENFAYTMLSAGLLEARRARRRRRQAGLGDLRQGRPHRDDAQQGRRVSSFRLERLLLGAVAADRPRLPRAALPHHPGHPLVAHLRHRHQARSDARRRSTRSSSPRRSSRRPAIRGRTPSIAGRRASTSARWAAAARTAPTGLPASSSWIARPSRSSAAGRSTAGRRTLHYDFWWNLPRDYMVSSEWGLPPQFENGIVPEDLLGQQIRPPAPFLGSARAAQRADHRSRRQSPDGARSAARARSGQANTASSASSSTRPISKARSGPGGARAASSTSRRPRRSRPSPRRRTSCRRC